MSVLPNRERGLFTMLSNIINTVVGTVKKAAKAVKNTVKKTVDKVVIAARAAKRRAHRYVLQASFVVEDILEEAFGCHYSFGLRF